MSFILHELGEKLNVVNRALLDPDDYNLNRYDDLKLLYDIIMQKGSLSISESQAFLEELRLVRKE